MKPTKISSIELLDEALDNDIHEFFIALGAGRSSKDIYHGEEEGFYEIYNYIDDTEQVLTKEQLMDEEYTNIGKAIKNGCFYAY